MKKEVTERQVAAKYFRAYMDSLSHSVIVKKGPTESKKTITRDPLGAECLLVSIFYQLRSLENTLTENKNGNAGR